MPESEKNIAKQIQQVADSIPATLRAAALDRTSTYLHGLADMARLVSPAKMEDQPHEE